jgi:hypothetical protein
MGNYFRYAAQACDLCWGMPVRWTFDATTTYRGRYPKPRYIVPKKLFKNFNQLIISKLLYWPIT